MEGKILVLEPNKSYTFPIIYEIFKDIIYKPMEEKVNAILTEYNNDENKILFGYFLNKKLIGVIGIEENDIIKILYFGFHKNYRNKGYGTKLMDYIKNKYSDKKLYLTTDDDAIGFYKKYGYKAIEYYEEKNGEKNKRYKCEYNK
ncbi:GNAT family N-acetyltransferase [Breznakiellaceae bacterium SP9]